jgi:hypothetical protein
MVSCLQNNTLASIQKKAAVASFGAASKSLLENLKKTTKIVQDKSVYQPCSLTDENHAKKQILVHSITFSCLKNGNTCTNRPTVLEIKRASFLYKTGFRS